MFVKLSTIGILISEWPITYFVSRKLQQPRGPVTVKSQAQTTKHIPTFYET